MLKAAGITSSTRLSRENGGGPALPKRIELKDFTGLMTNRLRVGAIRYQRRDVFANPTKDLSDDFLEKHYRCIRRYMASGNLEHLVDAANYLALEAARPLHQMAHFRALDRDKCDWSRVAEA